MKNKAEKIWAHIKHPIYLLIAFAIVLGVLRFGFGIKLENPIFTTSALIFGWFMAFYTANWNQREAALNRLRYEAYGKIEPALTAVKLSLTPIHQTISAVEKVADNAGTLPLYLVTDWQLQPAVLGKQLGLCGDRFVELLSALESQQILFLDLLPLRRALTIEWNRVNKRFYMFHSNLLKTVATDPNPAVLSTDLKALVKESAEINSLIWDMAAYFHDYGLNLQNEALSPIVGRSMSRRQTTDPKYLTLDQLPNEYENEHKGVGTSPAP
jgi:hypothetical protein